MTGKARAESIACRIELFGGIRARIGEALVERFRTRNAAALLALVALTRERSRTREALMAALWPDADSKAARHGLRQALLSVRRALDPPGVPGAAAALVASRETIALDSRAVATDVADFEAALARAERGGESEARAALEIAVALNESAATGQRVALPVADRSAGVDAD